MIYITQTNLKGTKRFYLHYFMLTLCLFQTIDIIAQDKIITNDDRIIIGYNLEIGEKAIFYNVDQSSDSELKRIEITDIMIIKRKDGSIIDTGKNSCRISEDQTLQESQADNSTIFLSDLAKDKNQKYINQINSPLDLINTTIYNKEFNKDKKTNFGVLQYGVTDNSILETDELVLSFKLNLEVEKRPRAIGLAEIIRTPNINVYAKNISDNIIYIDLGNTFFNSSCIYVPTSSQVTTSSTNGVGVNLGGIAGALGLSGAIGSLASAVSVGGSSGQSTTEITFSKRILAIPPHSEQLIFTSQMYSIDLGTGITRWTTPINCIKNNNPKDFQGVIKKLDYNDCIDLDKKKVFVTYSKTEDLSSGTANISAEIYTLRLYYLPITDFSEIMNNPTGNNLWYNVKLTGK